jgi:alpha-L-rhamnosidase
LQEPSKAKGNNMINISSKTCEYEKRPLAVSTKNPRFSWKLETQGYNVIQCAYRLQVYMYDWNSNDYGNLLWDTERIVSEASLFVEYKGPELKERERYCWRVRIWATVNHREEESGWSDFSFLETDFLDTKWKAPFINGLLPDPGPHYLRRTFFIEDLPESARVYVTALGMYELWINGKRAGEDLLRPGWTNYKKRLPFQTYDVGELLLKGENVIGAAIAEGWYAGDLTWLNERNLYGDATALSLQLYMFSSEGAESILMTDPEWKSSSGPILYSQLYHGEIYDARLEQEGWNAPGFDDRTWGGIASVPFEEGNVISQDGPSVVKRESLEVKEVIKTPRGETVLDFGQNVSGWVRFTVDGKAGDRVCLKHAEILDRDGNFYTDNMRSARNSIEYTLKGDGPEIYEPHFTFQGFRYVHVTDYPGPVRKENFIAQVIHSDMEETLEFKTSNELLNRLHSNILWGWKGNSVDIPTDCPQRDERLGWTGDAQVFIGTAAYLMDVNHFFRKWLKDLSSEQRSDGGVPYVIPDILTGIAHKEKNLKDTHSSTGWGDAAVICPWTLYEHYGDKRVLEEQYFSMLGWVEYIHNRAENGLLWKDGFHFADWVALDAEEGSYFGATPSDLVATAYYAYSVSLLIKAARVLGKHKDASKYKELYSRIVQAFRDEFFTPAGKLSAKTQTGHILALVLDLVPERYRAECADDLRTLIAENDGHLTTGFLGTPWICRALSENGHLEEAYTLLLKEDYPSWLFQIHMGATTVWEHWDGMKSDGSLWSPDMNSFNHYAYGAVGQWMYKNIGGMYPHPENGAGWRDVVYSPLPGGSITWCRMSYTSGYGVHKASWALNNGCFTLDVEIPPNTKGTIVMPEMAADIRSEPSVVFSEIQGVSTAFTGSGKYHLTAKLY